MPPGDPTIHRSGRFSISDLSYTTQIESLKGRLAKTEAEAARAKADARLMEGRIHRALQDAFQAGAITMSQRWGSSKVVAEKHKYCDDALKILLKGGKP